MYPDEEYMIIAAITKRIEIIMSTQVCLIPRMNFNYMENGGKKLFLQIQSINIVYPNVENMIVVPITKRTEIIVGTQVCLIPWLNFHYEENGGKKCFSYKTKA